MTPGDLHQQPRTDTTLVIDVPGRPAPQGSFSAIIRNGRPLLIQDNQATKPWRTAVTLRARARANLTGWATVDGPVAVDVTFWLTRPAAASRRLFPHVPPDLDKLARACLDALTAAGVWADDARVVDLVARKRYAQRDTGARITVTALDGVQAAML